MNETDNEKENEEELELELELEEEEEDVPIMKSDLRSARKSDHLRSPRNTSKVVWLSV